MDLQSYSVVLLTTKPQAVAVWSSHSYVVSLHIAVLLILNLKAVQGSSF